MQSLEPLAGDKERERERWRICVYITSVIGAHPKLNLYAVLLGLPVYTTMPHFCGLGIYPLLSKKDRRFQVFQGQVMRRSGEVEVGYQMDTMISGHVQS